MVRRFVALQYVYQEGILSAPQHGLESDHLIGALLHVVDEIFVITSRACMKYINMPS